MKSYLERRVQGMDYWFLVGLIFLVVLGLIVLQTASISLTSDGGGYQAFFNQLYLGVLPGIGLFLVTQVIPYAFWRRSAIVIYIFTLILNILVVVPALGVGEEVGATRWLEIGSFSFQPSELLKLSLILCLSIVLTKRKDKINHPTSVMILLLIILLPVGVVGLIQSNLSTGLLIGAIGGILLALSRLHLLWFGALIGVCTVLGGVLLFTQPYRLERVSNYLMVMGQDQVEMCTQETTSYWHICQNLIAIGSGQVTGVGLGEGVQKFSYVPESTNDSIFAVYAEEAGLFGVVIFFTVLIWIIYRLLVIAGNQREDDFARLVVLGVIAWFVLQNFINIGSTIGLLPVTGITLPFISQGNTSLWVLFTAFGIVGMLSRSPTRKS